MESDTWVKILGLPLPYQLYNLEALSASVSPSVKQELKLYILHRVTETIK